MAQAGIDRSPAALRVIKQDYDMHFGFYANVVREGRVRVSEQVRSVEVGVA